MPSLMLEAIRQSYTIIVTMDDELLLHVHAACYDSSLYPLDIELQQKSRRSTVPGRSMHRNMVTCRHLQPAAAGTKKYHPNSYERVVSCTSTFG